MNKPREEVTPKRSELVVHNRGALYISTLGWCPLTLIALSLSTAKSKCYWNDRDSNEYPVAPPILTLSPPQPAPITRRTEATFAKERAPYF